MRKTHNKLFYGAYTHKAVFKMPWAGWLYPTTDEHLQRLLLDPSSFVGHMQFSKDIFKITKYRTEIIKLAEFILKNRKHIKFRIQSENTMFYGNKDVILGLVSKFWDNWANIQTVATHKNRLPEPNTVFCKRLPLGKYQYQIHIKKNLHTILKSKQREELWSYLSQNTDVACVSSAQLQDFLSGKSDFGWDGYFYVTEEKMITPIYMIAPNIIHKILKHVQI